MLTERESWQMKLHVVTLEDLVPAEHLLRKLAAIVDFSFIYDAVREQYSTIGRPSIDPVVLVKYLLIGFLYGIESERRIEQEIRVNMAYRWFLGLDIDERVPDHSTISQNRRRRFGGQELFRQLFEHVLFLCMEHGLADGRLILTDSTHVKANASKHSLYSVSVEQEAAWFIERLDLYEALERERLADRIKAKGKRSRSASAPKLVDHTISVTDPDSGFLSRPGKPSGMHYLSHQSLDANCGIIVDVTVTPANVTDSAPFLDRMEHLCEHIGLNIEAVGVDSAYDISLVHQELSEKGIEIYTPENEEKPNYKVDFTREAFRYDEEADAFICPAGHCLRLNRLARGENTVSRVYQARESDCNACPLRERCVAPSHNARRVLVNIFENAVRRSHEKDGTRAHKRVLELRQIWCEGTFAAQKERHNLRRLFRRGLQAAEEHCLLSATAMNLKRMVKYLG
jgi:transposase